MALEVQVYDNAIVQSSRLSPKYLTSLACIAKRDYRVDFGFPNKVLALDMDRVEIDSKGQNDKTMDAAIGIANFSSNKISSQRLLLVELRMNYTGQGDNSRTSEMKSKDAHTRSLLCDSPVDKRSCFIFSKNVAACKRNAINRESQNDSTLRNWIIMSPDDFIGLFLFVDELPYQPQSPIDEIRECGSTLVATSDYDNAINLINYWLRKTESYYNQYKLEECRVLVNVIDEVAAELLACKEKLSEDNYIDIMIAGDSISRYKSLLNRDLLA